MPAPILTAPDSANPQVITGGLVVQAGATAQVAKPLVVQNAAGTNVATVDLSGNTALSGTLAVTGATTLTGAVTASGAVTVSGALSAAGGVNPPAAVVGTTDPTTITAAQSGATFVATKGSGNQTFRLPDITAATAPQMTFTFICGNVLTGMTIKPATTDTTSVIKAKTTASGTAIASTASTGSIVNTQGTAVLGDTITLTSTSPGATALWLMTAQSGIFAAT